MAASSSSSGSAARSISRSAPALAPVKKESDSPPSHRTRDGGGIVIREPSMAQGRRRPKRDHDTSGKRKRKPAKVKVEEADTAEDAAILEAVIARSLHDLVPAENAMPLDQACAWSREQWEKEEAERQARLLQDAARFRRGGKLAHWCWLKALTVLDNRWSWGTAALAYLYRQLDEACRRSGSGGIGGCMLLLSVWSWDRLSVGRPRVLNERPWPHHPHFPDQEPTWAYLWDNVSEMSGDPKIMYMQYTAELDTLTAEQVEWEPYGSYYRIGASMTDLNHKCTEEARFWRMRCPLICMWLVEHHQPQRVMRQFGMYQECPPVWQDTDKALHR
ncbi:uncharacterized protein [Lolium perenne]|uniref:uncharacterized protein n=1 Tax=Lolium perenne TaxID=4522 RepID=UPI003A99B501